MPLPPNSTYILLSSAIESFMQNEDRYEKNNTVKQNICSLIITILIMLIVMLICYTLKRHINFPTS
jgi:hypothetical protein